MYAIYSMSLATTKYIHVFYKVTIFFLMLFSILIAAAKPPNCCVKIQLTDTTGFRNLYINDASDFYYYDSIGVISDSFCLAITEPKPVTLFINNDAENVFPFYLEEGNYTISINCKTKAIHVIGSILNDEYKEMMRVHDSLFKKYNIMQAILYPYNGMNRDSAHALLNKYLPLCNKYSDIHIKQFYETHLNSFLTLNYIYTTLEYTFENPAFDTAEYDIPKLKILFDKLDPALKKYELYNKCSALFKKESVKPPTVGKPLWKDEPNGKH